jgi:hypothetical protein
LRLVRTLALSARSSGEPELSFNFLEIPVRLSGNLRARKDNDGNERDNHKREGDRERQHSSSNGVFSPA